jgi:hypothetical protein
MNNGKRPNQSDISRLSCSSWPNETDSQAQRCARLARISGGNGGELSAGMNINGLPKVGGLWPVAMNFRGHWNALFRSMRVKKAFPFIPPPNRQTISKRTSWLHWA